MTASKPARLDDITVLAAAGVSGFYFGAAAPVVNGWVSPDHSMWLLAGFFLPLWFVYVISILHPYRRLGLLPPSAVVLAAAAAAAVAAAVFGLDGGSVPAPFFAIVGLCCLVPWGVGLIWCAATIRRHRTTLSTLGAAAGGLAFCAGPLYFGPPAARAAQRELRRVVRSDIADGIIWAHLLAVSLGLAVWCVHRLKRPFVELMVEALVRPMYRLKVAGPGVAAFPVDGPVVVIANHAAYLDPLFLAGFIPRPTTPMMTATFFDKPVIRPLMRHVFDTIRVPEAALKRDAPEIAQAIAALDAGKCLVVFPEGYLRRKDEVPLRRFGRGVWEVLRAHPDVPVVACWIDGGWGSYFSFKDGPPMSGKRPDFRRPIDVGVSAPEAVPADVLADHLATRRHLMERVLAARAHLGREPLAADLPAGGDGE